MLKKIIGLVVIVLCLAAIGLSAYAYDHGDFQIWNTNGEEFNIGKATKFTMEQEFRYAENASEFFYQHYDWGFAWSFDKRLDLNMGYRYVLERIRHKWMEEDEPYVALTWKQDIWKFKFDDRNRIEYRHFRYAPDQIRYRNRFGVKYPFEYKKITVAPYVSDEIFVSSNGTGFNQNRFETGIEFGLTKYIKCYVAYMQQQARGRNNKWYTSNVLWLKEKISF